MGLELGNTLNRYVRLAETALVFATSKPPEHSEILKACSITINPPKASGNLEDTIEPRELTAIRDAVIKHAFPNTGLTWGNFTWTNKKPDLFNTVYALIPFMNDLDKWFILEDDYFPVPEITDAIGRLKESNTLLNADTQLNLLDTTNETLISNSYLLSLALRTFARNADSSRGVSCTMEESIKVLKRLPAFPLWEMRSHTPNDLNIATNAGDWYHFWTCVVLGALAEKHYREVNTNDIVYKLKFCGYEFLLTNTSELTSLVRHRKNRCGFHESADKNGFLIGRMVAQRMSGEH